VGLGGPVGVAIGSYSLIVVEKSFNFSLYSLIVVVVVGSGSNGLMLVVITGNMSIVVSGGVIGGVIEVSGN